LTGRNNDANLGAGDASLVGDEFNVLGVKTSLVDLAILSLSGGTAINKKCYAMTKIVRSSSENLLTPVRKSHVCTRSSS
jgi:hypothetical protein